MKIINKLNFAQRIIAVLSLLAATAFALLLFPQIRQTIIYIAERYVTHRPLTMPWHNVLIMLSFFGIAASLAAIVLAATTKRWLHCFDKLSLGNNAFRNLTELQPVCIILFVFIVYMLKNIFLVLGISGFNHIILLIAIAVHAAAVWAIYKNEKNKREILLSVVVCFCIIAASLALSALIYDCSYDGLAYHQPGVVKLRDGWNPFAGFLPDDDIWLYVNHYPKFTEMLGGFFASLCGTIEVHKSYNLIFFIALFLYALNFTARYQKSGFIVFLLGAVFCANPVAMVQLFTGYVDGVLGMVIMLLVFSLIDFERSEKRRCLIIALALSVFAVNIKMTGFIAGIVLIAYLVRNFICKKYKTAFLIMASGVLVLLLGVLFAGYNPYILNTTTHGHPFYPLYGKNSVDIIYPVLNDNGEIIQSGNMPDELVPMHPVQRFFCLFFLDYSRRGIPLNPLKLIELVRNSNDQRIAGFGAFFFEIVALCATAGFISLFKNKTGAQRQVVFPCLLLTALALITPENWWARYIPYLWYMPFLFILPANFNRLKTVFICLAAVTAVNGGPSFGINLLNVAVSTKSTNVFIRELRDTPEENITVCIYADHFKYSVLEKLRQNNINKNIIFIADKEAVSRFPCTYVKYWESLR